MEGNGLLLRLSRKVGDLRAGLARVWVDQLTRRLRYQIGTTVYDASDGGAHSGLASLGWTISGHTGTAYAMPAFDSAGAATSVGPASTFDDYGLQVKTTGPVVVRQGYSHPEHAQSAGIQFNGGTWSIIGQPNISTAGSTSDVTDGSKNWTRFVSNTTLGAAAGIRQAGTIFRYDHLPIFDLYIKTGSSLANQRIWICITPVDTSNSDTAPNNSVGLNYSSVLGDTTWYAYCRDGSAQTRVDTGTAIATDTAYRIRIRVLSSSIKVSINGGAEVTASTNFPSTSTQAGWVTKAYTNSAGTAVRLDFAYQHHKEA